MPTSDNTPLVLHFGGKEYILPLKFNLRELRDLSMVSSRQRPTDPGELEAYHFDTSAEMLEIATRRCETPLKVDDVYLTETDFAEIIIAKLLILKHSELLAKEAPKPGEEVAAA